MALRVGTSEREGYATALAELCSALAGTLDQLDGAAGHLDDDELAFLPTLQYRLHEAAELLSGMQPPLEAEETHEELIEALEEARDLTGMVAESGWVLGPVHQWRAALFRVRLARSQLSLRRSLPEPTQRDYELSTPSLTAPLAALTLTLLGAIALAVGATLGPWHVWAVGVGLVGAGLLVYRP